MSSYEKYQEKYAVELKARPLRDRSAIRALLKTPGPKTEAEVIEIMHEAFMEGYKAGHEKGSKKVLGLVYDLGPEVRKAFQDKHWDAN